MMMEELTTLDNICDAFYQCSKASHWKESTQRFKMNLLFNALELQEQLRNETYQVAPTIDFELCERGKHRQINAPVIRDRVVQKMLMNHILLPALTRPLIYDNYASLKDKGTSLARKRIDVMLQRYVRKHGTEGYVLQVDIRKYFESIDHETLKGLYRKEVHEPDNIMRLIDYMIDTASKSDKGLNLGSECPQIFAVYYLHSIDTWMKVVCGEKYYGRYMDDIFVISDDKEHLKELLKGIKERLAELKLEINEQKTRISKLTHGFTYLQMKYSFNGNHIVKRLTHEKIARERRRLRAFRRLTSKGKMTQVKAYNCYRSWRQTAVKDSNACYDSIQSIDKLFRELYPNCQTKDKKTRTDIVNQIFSEVDPEDIEAMWKLTRRQEHSGRVHFGIDVVGVSEVDAADFG